jgi:prepilin peptidase CpaA
MASPLTAPAPNLSAAPDADDLGLDRAFLMSMARIPLLALIWVAAVAVLYQVTSSTAPNIRFLAPVIVICVGMILAAAIDGYAFKVPNWVTLALVMSGWYLGLLHNAGVHVDDGIGGFGSALLGTFMGWALLFPALFIGGMGQGDVKMQMGFGAWVGATFGIIDGPGGWILFWAFSIGVIVGGVFGLVMMALRRQFYKNVSNFREIFTDLQVMVTLGPKAAATRANERRKDWVRLPYGVPLCVGFLGYLGYLYYLA